MSEPINNTNLTPAASPATVTAPVTAPEPAAEKTFTQAELDKIVGKRIAKALKDVPSDEELSGYRKWKESQETEREKQEKRDRELAESKTALSAAQAELEQFKREKFLLGKGVPADDVDYYAYKIGKLVTDTVDFEKAAEGYLKDNPPAGTVQVDLSAPLGGGKPEKSVNETMNSLIRGARN